MNAPRRRRTQDFLHADAYEKFAARQAMRCRCADGFRPCDGVLAGGLCDELGQLPAAHIGDDADADGQLWADDDERDGT